MRLGAIGFLLGTLLLQQLQALPPAHWCLLLGLLAPLAVAYPRLRLPAAAGCGLLWALAHSSWLLSQGLAPRLEGADLVVEGVVASIPREIQRGLRFQLAAVEQLEPDTAGGGLGRIQLVWYIDPPPLRVGERWRFDGAAKTAAGFL